MRVGFDPRFGSFNPKGVGKRWALSPEANKARLLAAMPHTPGITPVLASPPTVVQGAANALPQISGAVLVLNTDPRFAYLGSRRSTFIGSYVVCDAVLPTTGATTGGGTGWAVKFVLDGTECELNLQSSGGGGRWNAIIEYEDGTVGYLAPRGSFYTIAAGGANFRERITFPARGRRTITLLMNASVRFGGVYVEPSGNIVEPWTNPLRFCVMGDSFGEGSNQTRPCGGYAWTLGRHYLGMDDVWSCSTGATSFAATAGGTRFAYWDNRVAEMIGLNPDIVVVQGSINGAGDASAELAKIPVVFNALRSGLPNALIIGTGVPGMSGVNAIFTTLSNAIQSAVLGLSGLSLFVAAPITSNNITFYRDADAAHPSADGHDYIANVWGHNLRSQIARL